MGRSDNLWATPYPGIAPLTSPAIRALPGSSGAVVQGEQEPLLDSAPPHVSSPPFASYTLCQGRRLSEAAVDEMPVTVQRWGDGWTRVIPHGS